MLQAIETPALLLDLPKVRANIARMRAALAPHGVELRPHLKTCKSVEVARLMTEGWGGAVTVSTLKEADRFFAAGFRDILYAVGLAPNKLAHAATLRRAGANLCVIVDSVETARAIADFGRTEDLCFPVMIEIDSDRHRAGVAPDDAETLVAIGHVLAVGPGASLRGVMTHGGGAYDTAGAQAIAAHAELERSGAVQAAETLRANGLACEVVSVGSTPTALFGKSFERVSEVRVGVYVFQDLVMAGLGVCQVDEIALSVLTSVIGHQREKNWLIVDAGWMAMSRDRGTSGQAVDQGYGLVRGAEGEDVGDLIMIKANQEHGIVALRDGGAIDFAGFPVGSLLRVLPNHACATAAQFDRYQVIDGTDRLEWPRFSGW